MVQVDLPFTFGVGALMATAVEPGLRSTRASYYYLRGLAATLILQTLFVVWLPVYLLVNHFGFQTSHMWWHGDRLTDYPVLLPAFLVAYFAATLCGYHAGARLVIRGRTAAARAIFVAACAFFAAWMALQPYRTLTLGTYAQWRAGEAVWIWHVPSFVALLAAAFLLFAAALWLFYRAIAREARAEPAQRQGAAG